MTFRWFGIELDHVLTMCRVLIDGKEQRSVTGVRIFQRDLRTYCALTFEADVQIEGNVTEILHLSTEVDATGPEGRA